jgi:lysophospholipase L1-like esterase
MTVRGHLLSGLVATVIAVAGFVTVGAPAAAAGPTGTLQYVALGDSYAAGIGAPPYVSSSDRCLQSNKGYPALLDPKGRIDLQVNATCPGATTTDVAVKQVPELTPDVELVTLTVGGNDLGFAGLAGTCTTPGKEPECLAAIQAIGLLQFQELYRDLTTLLYGNEAGVADKAPNALIVVTGYPHLVESTAPFPPQLIAALNAATDQLNSTIQNAVDDADAAVDPTRDNFVYVDVTDAFEGHGIGSLDDPFINAPTPDGSLEDFHPNAAGYRAYAKAISAAIRDALDSQKQLA